MEVSNRGGVGPASVSEFRVESAGFRRPLAVAQRIPLRRPCPLPNASLFRSRSHRRSAKDQESQIANRAAKLLTLAISLLVVWLIYTVISPAVQQRPSPEQVIRRQAEIAAKQGQRAERAQRNTYARDRADWTR